jgi:hypothetical protein
MKIKRFLKTLDTTNRVFEKLMQVILKACVIAKALYDLYRQLGRH